MVLGLQQKWVWNDHGAAERVAGAADLRTASLPLMQLAVPGAAQALVMPILGAAVSVLPHPSEGGVFKAAAPPLSLCAPSWPFSATHPREGAGGRAGWVLCTPPPRHPPWGEMLIILLTKRK